MPNYEVEVFIRAEHTHSPVFVVEASSMEEAERKVKNRFDTHQSSMVIDCDTVYSVSGLVVKETDKQAVLHCFKDISRE